VIGSGRVQHKLSKDFSQLKHKCNSKLATTTLRLQFFKTTKVPNDFQLLLGSLIPEKGSQYQPRSNQLNLEKSVYETESDFTV